MFLSYGILLTLLLLSIWSFVDNSKINNLSKISILCVFLSAVIMFYPCYIEIFQGIFLGNLKAILACVHHTIRLFLIDGELTFVIDYVVSLAPESIISPYIALASVIFIITPLFTLGFILSLFKSISSYIHSVLGYRKDKYYFSDINEATLYLAEDIRKNHPSAMILFFDTDEKKAENQYDYSARIKAIKGVCFRISITSFNVSFGSARAQNTVFLLSNDENENYKQAVIIRDKYPEKANLKLYVHSVFVDNEPISVDMSDNDFEPYSKIKIRKIIETKKMINNILYDSGHKIFDSAVESENNENRIISALVIGVGKYGKEMLKALPWFCQMDGYLSYINAVDINPLASSCFAAMCPELMDEKHNGDFSTVGESHYKITFFDGIDVNSSEFVSTIGSIPNLSYVFISLGDDMLNIATAKNVRIICSRLGLDPVIQTVVFDYEKIEILESNKTNEKYGIDFVGDIKTFYSERVIMASELESEALQRHLNWGTEASFWDSGYNYQSSVASVIHRKMKEYCKIPQIETIPELRDEAEKTKIEMLEHRRWNAYMRSEGYVYGKEKNHTIKTHCDLIPFYDLSCEEQEKDNY